MIQSGQVFSIITSGASGWATVWHVTTTEGSALKLTTIMALSQLPLGPLAPSGGVTADRYNRCTIMIIPDLGMGGMSLTLGTLAWLGHRSLALICLFTALRNCLQTFHFPAMSAAMPVLVPEKHFMRISTLDQAVGSIANIGPSAISTALYTALGSPYTLSLELVEMFLVVAGLALTRIPSAEAEMPPTIMGQIRGGWCALSVSSGLVSLIVALIADMMVSEVLAVVYLLMMQQYFRADRIMMSVAEAITGTHMLVDAVIIMAWGGDKRLALFVSATTVAVGLLFAAVGLFPRSNLWTLITLMGFGYIFLAWFHAPLVIFVRRHVEEDKVGYVLGLFQLMLGLAMPVGMVLGSTFAEKMGGPVLFTASGAFFCVVGAVIYAIPRICDFNTSMPVTLPFDDEGAQTHVRPFPQSRRCIRPAIPCLSREEVFASGKKNAIPDGLDLEHALITDVTSSTLFDLPESDTVFRNEGKEKCRTYRCEHLGDVLESGVASPFIRHLLDFNDLAEGKHLVEIAILSRNDPETRLRVMRSVKHHRLDITRAIFMQGRAPYRFTKPLRTSLFLSANEDNVYEAIDMRFAARHVVGLGTAGDEGNDLRIVFGFDGVLVDDSAERVFQTGGLDKYQENESALAEVPTDHEPMADFLEKINGVQGIKDSKSVDDPQGYRRRIRVAVVTVHSAPAHECVINSIGQRGLSVNDAFFLRGLPKGPMLEMLQLHTFFDDQHRQVEGASLSTLSVHIPFGEINREQALEPVPTVPVKVPVKAGRGLHEL